MLKDYGLVIASIATTALCWGVYGPVLHWGQAAMGGGRMRPFMCVGLAYFVIAVVVPIVMLYALGNEAEQRFHWTASGVLWSFIGGAVGALGALGIIMAFNFGGKPIYVMPLVFGCAPVINTLFNAYFNKAWKDINPFFAAGLIMVLAGAVTVLIFAPKPHKTDSHSKAPAAKAVAGKA